MESNDIRFEAVNWEHGMLLTPEHFLRQESYLESAQRWMLRYTTPAFGLIGGGPRLEESERGAVKHDPIVTIEEDETSLRVSVSQCRGLTAGGLIVDVSPETPLHAEFSKVDLEGVSEARLYVLADPLRKHAADGPLDEANPQMKSARRPDYRLSLAIRGSDAPRALPIARLRRAASGVAFEKDASYIPPCASMVSHSELAAGWRRLVEQTESLTERYAALYRSMQEYLSLFRERGLETEIDEETMRFVGRLTIALQDSVYTMLDPVQPSEQFFGNLRRALHSAALYLDLSPPVKQYYSQLAEAGETEYLALLEQQKQLASMRRRWRIQDDLGAELRDAMARLRALERLELALEGKYVDFRVSPALEGMNFLFDRGGRALYKIAAKHSRLQGFEDDLTIHFAGLRLEGRDRYRLILTGEDGVQFEPGEQVRAEIRINEGAGFRREPIRMSAEARSAGQRNFEFDFEAPDVATITDLRVTVAAHQPIRGAVLFRRHRFYAATPEAPQVRKLEPAAPPQESFEAMTGARTRDERSSRVAPGSRLSPPATFTGDVPRAPWEQPPQRPHENEPAPRRRRRLE